MRRTGNMTRGAMAACGQAKRVYAVRSALLLLVMLCGVALACIPMDFRNSTSNEHSPKVPLFVEVHLNAAYAYDVSDAPYASALLTNYAESAGLTDNEFVVTVYNALTAATGANLLDATRDVSWSFADTLASNLDSLTDAADYPAWDTLSESDKTAYGSKENYDKSKFNSLLDAFGFGETTDGFYSSGGGTFDPGTGILRKLEKLGNIGRNWINGTGNLLSSVSELLDSDSTTIINNFLGTVPTDYVGETQIAEWPTESVGRDGFYVAQGTSYVMSTTLNNNVTIRTFTTSSTVFWCVFRKQGQTLYEVFSKSPFTLNNNGTTVQASLATYEGKEYYRSGASFTYTGQNLNDNLPINEALTSGKMTIFRNQCEPLILYGQIELKGYTKIPEYPEEIPSGNTFVYAPETVNNTNNTWNNYITQPEKPRPDNPYNPENQTGGSQWREDTTDNVMPLMGIRFDNLFPFSLVFDLPKLSNKVSELTLGQATSGVYDTVRIPIVAGDIDEQLELDLTPLRQLLNMFRPFVFVLILVTMVMSLVLFWKSILTGD